MPRSSYLDLFLVFEFEPGARHVEALEELGDALNKQEQAGERHDRLERPEDGTPSGLVRGLVDLPGIEGLMAADCQQYGQAREEKQKIRDGIDPTFLAGRKVLPEKIGANVGALVQRIGRAQHEQGAVEHVG